MKSSKAYLLGFVIAASTTASALADGGGQYHDHGMTGGNWLFGPIMMLLFIGLIFAAIVAGNTNPSIVLEAESAG